ncbi:hypothetical protein KZ829_27195 [Actinoplanes hulinensis]|uniref:Uncharacterized protein n=1 Tax=Actinoplanes hulinensis TaxID=1144547 RepID=A0ABS7BAG5_9ACTN|nr:hypothetical protein [Actinoplanes hulinensis]MBW6437424.1 hypothetical protein [Actinoplanes hulinensis]
MSSEDRFTASPGYAFGLLQRALDTAVHSADPQVRARARDKVARWEQVIAGLASGHLTVGSRTPVADTPTWVTLEVAHGGFATGRYLAESPLRDDEMERLRSLPAGAPGSTDRERLNLWYLGDEGQTVLLHALRTEQYRIGVPEESALLVVAWLLDQGQGVQALDLVAELRPLMHRLRFTPRLTANAAPSGAAVRLESVGTVAAAIRRTRVPAQLAAMRETVQVWHPLYDRLVALWCDTVNGDLPSLADVAGKADARVVGGWPCQMWPADWAERRGAWLADVEAAAREHRDTTAHRHAKGNFARLHQALERCPVDSRALSGREVGWIRRALANTITRHGAPGSETRAALRSTQAAIVAHPTYATLAQVLAGRLDRYAPDGGLPAIDPIAGDVADGEAPDVPAGSPIPHHLIAKTMRALEAPISDLVTRGVITSGEVLARVLPQITSQLLAANLADPALAAVYAHTYAAFRRRRSLLLLNLQHQVQFDELPWTGVLTPLRIDRDQATRAARQTLRQVTLLAFTAFPHAILPNPLVREIGALTTQAGLRIPLVEEVAADIFMGTFTTKWRDAAEIASRALAGTLYARYYDLPEAAFWSQQRPGATLVRRWGKQTAADFAALCTERAKEAQTAGGGNWVAGNGTVLEQSQILTTHNLTTLIEALDLGEQARQLAPDLAERILDWVVRRQARPCPDHHAALQVIKNTAYAWRQAMFFLSLCDEQTQRAAVTRLQEHVTRAGIRDRFAPAVDGLAHVVVGGRFTSHGTVDGHDARRFLGWTVGPHWCMPSQAERPAAPEGTV